MVDIDLVDLEKIYNGHQCIFTNLQLSPLGKGYEPLKSLGPIDRKFHGHGENDGFVLYEHIIKQFSSFCKHTKISDLKKKLSNKITCKQ